MKKFFRNKKVLTIFVVIIAILSILSITVRMRNRRNTPLFIQKMGNDTVTIMTQMVNWPLNLVTGGVSNVQDLLNTQQENDHLKKQVDDLGQTKARNNTLESENSQLKAALKLKSTLSDYDIINGSVISRAPDTWSDILVIDQGSRAGVQKNMAVMCGGGLIGRIIEVSATSSKVELITSTDKSANRFSVQAKSSNGKMVHGIISVNGDSQLTFTQVVDGRRLKKGTRVYTSGMGGRSPKGLLVGTVQKTTRDSFGLSDVIQINPAGNLNDPSIVSVIRRKVED
ncbi:rod shape-determining protein MreC [Lactobacillus hominis]|uniref:Cell shape-determining protein MreC n=1 Tax=Lactobacillus hominis DSM 23910 = CRBIP 24.179 TaxID=1423758 RepID=I7IV63_9LACO|nr:rod shape-determining protein MreC [Lactobacillus hominis]KRM86148.1 rod shape-determining protein MreC [Lactobacillus hominis DSM 23910 = CRBIP 24.179]MCT3348629.1 rod shape-determining protein MreC [Lactobacillus hominis]CCI80893.1 Rod shape-determining protein MreC [Lactobacillus hominis DSM 23910 = CRBIP 24.179]